MLPLEAEEDGLARRRGGTADPPSADRALAAKESVSPRIHHGEQMGLPARWRSR